eukprot:CAMPEP_0117584320 /NCGR_PEP_ID=MMETSP0784-20121206/67531_1 /TAXON_ID=39447 /ORGANISM="" /LENGTH=164 /DNA_ID=CAMNT_0005385157 /DNA_START=98 /DNA_END=592 /DNA_ORIENTATION=+
MAFNLATSSAYMSRSSSRSPAASRSSYSQRTCLSGTLTEPCQAGRPKKLLTPATTSAGFALNLSLITTRTCSSGKSWHSRSSWSSVEPTPKDVAKAGQRGCGQLLLTTRQKTQVQEFGSALRALCEIVVVIGQGAVDRIPEQYYDPCVWNKLAHPLQSCGHVHV